MRRCGLWMIGSFLATGLLPGCALPFRHAKLCKSHSCDAPDRVISVPGHVIVEAERPDNAEPKFVAKNAATSLGPEHEQQEASILGPFAQPPQGAEYDPWPSLLPTESQDPPPQPIPPGAAATQVANNIPAKNEVLPEVLQCMLNKHHHDALKLLRKYDQASQDFFLGILPVVARVSEKPLESMNAEEVAVVQETLERLLETLRPRSILVVNKMCFCESVKGFGIYRPLPEGHVFQAGCPSRPGDLVQVYVELRNICSECREHYHETLLSSYVEISDPSDPKGRVLWKHRFDDSKQPLRSRALLHDYYNNYSFYVPHLPPGTYQLTIQVTDETRRDTPRVARKSVQFKVGARALQ